jgi:ribosomal subunit interface protein
MHVYLTARHLELSDEIRDYVEARLCRPVREHNGLKVTRLEIQLFPDGEKGTHLGCHVRVTVKGPHELNVRERGQTLLQAIDLAKDRVVRQLSELRDRLLTGHRHRRGEPA